MADVQVLRSADALPLQAVSLSRPRRRVRRFGLQGSEFTWAVAFVIPYAAVFLAFVAYPVVYGLWLGRDPALYQSVLVARNRKWVPKIEALLNDDQNYLVIVGTGHLVGHGSVIELLGKDGIVATQR